MVADLERDLAILAADADVDRAARGGVDERVADEVAEHLAQLVGVAEHDRGPVGLDADRAVGRGGVGVVDGVAGERREVDGSACGASATSSSLASVSRSSTSTPIRADSSSIRRIAFSTSSSERAAPMRYSSA